MQDFTATVITLVLVHRCSSRYQSCNNMRNMYTFFDILTSHVGQQDQVSSTLSPLAERHTACRPPGGGAMHKNFWETVGVFHYANVSPRFTHYCLFLMSLSLN